MSVDVPSSRLRRAALLFLGNKTYLASRPSLLSLTNTAGGNSRSEGCCTILFRPLLSTSLQVLTFSLPADAERSGLQQLSFCCLHTQCWRVRVDVKTQHLGDEGLQGAHFRDRDDQD